MLLPAMPVLSGMRYDLLDNVCKGFLRPSELTHSEPKEKGSHGKTGQDTGRVPVSYTHLDVYKRQALISPPCYD